MLLAPNAPDTLPDNWLVVSNVPLTSVSSIVFAVVTALKTVPCAPDVACVTVSPADNEILPAVVIIETVV